ncbi:hypothetical protein PInf_017824 [Phytophthora infestans]|nr:hypothetical protein PInf_017824 [Phytophthora infestans]
MAVGIPTMILELSGEGLASPLQKSLGDMMGEEEEDEAFATSLFLMDQIQQVCFKIPFLVDPLDRGASWIKQAYSNSTPSKGSSSFAGYIVVDASDPLFLRAIKTCVAQGDEAIVEAALELIVLLKKKGTCATWSHFAVVDFTQDPDNSSESVHNEIESLKSKLSIEKAKEEILFTSFLTNICAASDEAAQASTAGLNSTSISILSAWISSGSGHHGFYNEDSIERISAQLDDYMAVRHARMQLQQDLKSARALQV